MVKAVIGEETRLKSAEDRLSHSAVPSQVGLVIGKLSTSSDRCLVFDLVPTPPNDAGEPACSLIEADKKKGSKGKSQSDSSSSLLIDKDWVAEHARQVSRMLLGGVKVLGIYVWMSESSFKNSTIILCQTVKGVAESAPLWDADWGERLLIHISYSPRRWTCRNTSLASNISSSSLRPCDFKMGRVLASLQTFRCTYTFDLRDASTLNIDNIVLSKIMRNRILVGKTLNMYELWSYFVLFYSPVELSPCRLPICHQSASNGRKLADILRQAISSHGRELKDAKAMIDGNLVVEEESCVSDGLHEVQFLVPFMKDSYVEACSQKEVVGVLVFSGSVCSFAYSNSKEPLSQALANIKGDIITSLQSRLDVLWDESDGESGFAVDHEKEGSDELSTEAPFLQLNLHSLRRRCSLSFPRRVFIPWLAGTYICDYLQAAETLEVVKDHCVELMSMDAPTDPSTILELETEPLSLTTESFWDAAAPFSSTSSQDCSSSQKSGIATSQEHERKSVKLTGFNFMAAILISILSILVGLVLYTSKAL
ncbi:hypothetical protein RHGRI_021677 [Rhododendron griersonianum]|uniref:Protein odr-4 homolog n=1 Tax=Rhododendron griersonianum TaxID=479676 RepID=A0AAV6JL27_9ERIC|nr:hypothetical protein RHGRI_021677 [Rhododendron griersonianum]